MDGFSVHNWSYRTSWSKLLCRELVEQAKICYAENHWKSTILSGRNRSSRHFSQDEYEDLCSDESFVLGTTLFFVPWVLFISVSRVASLSQGKFLKVVVQFSLHNIYSNLRTFCWIVWLARPHPRIASDWRHHRTRVAIHTARADMTMNNQVINTTVATEQYP